MKAVYNAEMEAVICSKCGVEIWEGVDCDCGVDGVDHEGLIEAYEQKFSAMKKSSILKEKSQ
jgi:hypothetical protein